MPNPDGSGNGAGMATNEGCDEVRWVTMYNPSWSCSLDCLLTSARVAAGVMVVVGPPPGRSAPGRPPALADVALPVASAGAAGREPPPLCRWMGGL